MGVRPVIAILVLCSTFVAAAQRQARTFPAPQGHPEAVDDDQDFPFLPPLPAARLIETRRIDGPLELKQASADAEAMLAGTSYVRKTYHRDKPAEPVVFVSFYRDALFATGWKLVDATKTEQVPIQPEIVDVAAHYRENGRNVYARMTQEPTGMFHVNVADVGAEDWAAALARECRVRIHSIHFELDGAGLLLPDSEPTLRKLAELLSNRSAPSVEIEGHSDNIGEAGAAARQALSEKRAHAVAAWLTTQGGVPARKVTAKGYGKARPIAENDSDLGRALNRRIEIARRGCAKPAA